MRALKHGGRYVQGGLAGGGTEITDAADETRWHEANAGARPDDGYTPVQGLMYATICAALIDLSNDRDKKKSFMRDVRSIRSDDVNRRRGGRWGDQHEDTYAEEGVMDPHEWIFGSNQDWLFSFESCCAAIGADPDRIRRHIKNPRWRAPKFLVSTRLERDDTRIRHITLGMSYSYY